MNHPFNLKPRSILHDVAENFHRDAIDFEVRFDLLWEAGSLMHKMGRTKSFVDLLMGCECALKCDGLLSGLQEDPVVVYKRVRGCNHSIRALLQHAKYCADPSAYKLLQGAMENMPVHVRYSREAYELFFPAFIEPEAAPLNYSKTIGNNQWVLSIRAALGLLNKSVAQEFAGEISMDILEFEAHETRMREFANACRR